MVKKSKIGRVMKTQGTYLIWLDSAYEIKLRVLRDEAISYPEQRLGEEEPFTLRLNVAMPTSVSGL